MAYADVELLLTGWLASRLGVRCVTDLPANLEQVLPVVQVNRFAGFDDVPTLDRAHVDIDVFAADRQAAYALAEQVRSALRVTLPAKTVSGAVVTGVRTLIGPAWRPYDNTNVRRVGAAYEVTVQSLP